jgi:5-methyltetrahydropteroyltriglutamate--homocysteine methyltransferase
MAMRFPHSARVSNAPAALSEVRYANSAPINEDAARLKRMGGRFSECFMTAPSPGIVATTMLNQHYDSHEAYLTALAKALSNEYRAIYDAGLILQIDSPDLAMERHRFFGHLTEAEYLRQLELHIAAINLGIEGIPWASPETASGCMSAGVTMTGRISTTLRWQPSCRSFTMPMSEHSLSSSPIPGISVNTMHCVIIRCPCTCCSCRGSSNFVEHPELVARRLEEAVSVVGDRERVIAGTDCGFGTFAGREYVADEIVWVKLAAAAEGARIASRRLWGRTGR